jgi:hypothetical protein
MNWGIYVVSKVIIVSLFFYTTSRLFEKIQIHNRSDSNIFYLFFIFFVYFIISILSFGPHFSFSSIIISFVYMLMRINSKTANIFDALLISFFITFFLSPLYFFSPLLYVDQYGFQNSILYSLLLSGLITAFIYIYDNNRPFKTPTIQTVVTYLTLSVVIVFTFLTANLFMNILE